MTVPTATQERKMMAVACPYCDRETAVPVPDSDADLHVRRSVALFGDNTTAKCSDGHDFWVYFC